TSRRPHPQGDVSPVVAAPRSKLLQGGWMRSRNVVRLGEPMRRQATLFRSLTEQIVLAALGAFVPGVLAGWLITSGGLSSLPIWQIIGVILVLLCLAPLPAMWIAQRLARRIAALGRAVRRLAHGDFEVAMPFQDQDEIDDLAMEFNVAA